MAEDSNYDYLSQSPSVGLEDTYVVGQEEMYAVVQEETPGDYYEVVEQQSGYQNTE
jgi:hypothetical protein